METNYITLKENDSLYRFCKHYKKDIEEVKDKVISALLEYNILHDMPEECGISLVYALEQNDVLLDALCVECFDACGPTIKSFVKGFQIWGIHYECEECGCEIEEGICTNPGCKNDTNIYPDIDSMKGGRDYDL